MLKAKLDQVRKNKKGFSLVELIIVIAIMVALIAVLAPAYIKYVQKSRDSALATAAEDIATAMKTYVADPDYGNSLTSEGTMATLDNGTYFVEVSGNHIYFSFNAAGTFGSRTKVTTNSDLLNYAGIDDTKGMGKSNNVWEIRVSSNTYGKTTGQTVTGPVLSSETHPNN
ncbi:MAG: type II secretion system GspH family protein [Clostridiales bacterium]|nr:type II secretion system GspH family protein [Clostridiales bacterium]